MTHATNPADACSLMLRWESQAVPASPPDVPAPAVWQELPGVEHTLA